MSGAGSSVELLLLRAAPWTVAVDVSTVGRIERRTGGTPADHELSVLLGLGARGENRRVVEVHGAAASRVVAIGETLGTCAVPGERLQPLPALLRTCAPGWWLGVTWLGEGLVLLVDLFEAVVAAEAGVARG